MKAETLFSKRLRVIMGIIAVAMVVYHMTYAVFLIAVPNEHQNYHLIFLLLLIFLGTLKKTRKLWPVMLLLILASLVATAYVKYNFVELEIRAGFPTTVDNIVSIILVILVLEACREAYGLVIPVLALVFTAYFFLGHYLPGPIHHTDLSPTWILSNLGVGFNGVYGVSLGVSANYLFLFMVFGAVMQVAGVAPFFTEVGKLVGRKFRGGPAQTAVVSSALVGTVTGSALANVTVVGSFTIPLMKKAGYKPAYAGGIEAAASSGSQIMPPVMGASAFMMSAITGIPYFSICLAAAVPAVLYFVSIGIYVELIARRDKTGMSTQVVDKSQIWKRFPLFIIPFGVIIYLFAQQYTPMRTAFWAVIATLGAGYVIGFLIKDAPSLKKTVTEVIDGAIQGAKIGAACACIGIILSAVIVTGLGIKLSHAVVLWSQGWLWLATILTMIISIIIGCGVPTLPAYVLVAILIAPMFAEMGLPALPGHLFILYFAVFSAVTPPVAVAALPASAIAGATYLRTSVEAFKVSLIAFITPFVFVWNSSLLLQSSDLLLTAVTIIGVSLGLVPTAAALTGQYVTRLSWLELAFSIVCAIALMGSALAKSYILFTTGVALFGLFTLWQLRKSRVLKLKEAATS